MKELDRRAFLRLLANGSFSVMAGGFGTQFPEKWISPPLASAHGLKLTDLLTYTTTCRECPAGCGMHVFHTNGRALKAEGNPSHPVNYGGLCARGQSALQGVYDSHRVTQPMRRTAPAGKYPNTGLTPATWKDALESIGDHLRADGGRTFVISDLQTGTMAEIMRQFVRAFDGEMLQFEPFNYESLRQAHKTFTGEPVIPWYGLDECSHIISFSADFLESWVSNIQFTSMFARMHAYNGRESGKFTYAGPRLSMTAANADEFILIAPGAEYDLARCLLKIMVDRGWTRISGPELASYVRDVKPEQLPVKGGIAMLERVAREFSQARGGAALAGPAGMNGRGVERLAEAVFLLNYATGNIGDSVDFRRVHALSGADTEQRLVSVLEALKPQDVLILHQANPAYARPWFKDRLETAGLVVYLGQLPDETACLADWVLPVDNPLESWGDYMPWTGIHSFQQPAMQRLYDSRPAGDVFLSLADMGGRPLARSGDNKTNHNFFSWLNADWRQLEQEMTDRDYEQFLRHALSMGFVYDETTPGPHPPVSLERLGMQEELSAPGEKSPQEADLWVWPSIFFFDGRTANRSWLQENPQPMSFVAWQSWADIHPGRARDLGIEEGDSLKIASADAEVIVPVRITEEIHPSAIGLALGQGHWAMGEVAALRGVNGFEFLRQDTGTTAASRVSLAKGGGKMPLICLTASTDQYGRELLRWEKLSALVNGTGMKEPCAMPLPAGYDEPNDLYQGHRHADHRWAMVIDLQRCIGCGACSVACYAENNIAVLGPRALLQGRELSWLKVVPYRHPQQENTVGFLPLPCQHCDQAPCESVCPVFAAVHTEEGLNAQIYNRCVGTRYCSNNCPYKVRRFNWYNNTWQETLKWQLNPDVTVRCRGVMEKCTFCVQRILRVERQAKIEQRPVADGEVKPACVQSCPARVFLFGDLQDPESEVRKVFEKDPRGYQLLHELNTKPAVMYLKRIARD